MCVSFNGGKDCSALLHLIHAAWTARRRSSFVSSQRLRLRALYIRGQDPFPEMEQFIEDTRQRQLFFSTPFFLSVGRRNIPSTVSLLPSGYPGHFPPFFSLPPFVSVVGGVIRIHSLLYPPSCQSLTLIDPIHFARTPSPLQSPPPPSPPLGYCVVVH